MAARCPAAEALTSPAAGGYFSKLLSPRLEIDSGDYVTIEAPTTANDDAEGMIKGELGAESVLVWIKEKKHVDRRGAGPVYGKLLGRGSTFSKCASSP